MKGLLVERPSCRKLSGRNNGSSLPSRDPLVAFTESCETALARCNAWPMSGMRAFYRGTVVFAMLPDKRALERPRAIAYKLPAGTQRREGQKWQLVEMEGERDVGNALACLDKAYRRAGSTRK